MLIYVNYCSIHYGKLSNPETYFHGEPQSRGTQQSVFFHTRFSRNVVAHGNYFLNFRFTQLLIYATSNYNDFAKMTSGRKIFFFRISEILFILYSLVLSHILSNAIDIYNYAFLVFISIKPNVNIL